MNEQERSELERLKQRQARLEQELALFATQIKTLEQRLSQEQPQAAQKEVRPPEAAPVFVPPVPAPPVIPPAASAAAEVPGTK